MTEPSDRILIEKCKAGDTRAFGVLVDRYQKPIFNAALRMVRGYDDAQDIAQTTFVKAYEKLDTYNPKYEVFSWIYRIVINESINFLKARKPTVELDHTVKSDGNTPEENLFQKELGCQIEDSLMILNLDYRIVIALRHFLDFTYQEMGEILQIPEKTVKSRLFSARQRLCEIMTDRGIRAND